MPDTVLLHAVIAPDSESKMKVAGADAPPTRTTKSVVGLKTVPVGAPPGMLTTSGTMVGMLPLTPPV